ncbi:TonB-dependent receptor [Aurantiacibacter rhizosphaerae]|uniref:TonB-dependent receptor plug domain-containing protein n=1 Tax=Aurantiacibacter rhizosphaerae TaxID=2691582 RepID=A0A844XHS8_9SPHN|nr:TonB-dependent receptor plug domain-containing protein [Aurantiacibacter rhizosphaerae]MWV29105.1 TonB-dependent receptor plug domain-containing protein [Aurantiacibacter rhizosphaerae]
MAFGVATPAIAQDNQPVDNAAEADAISSNAIVVTATLREQTLQEVPVAVSVVSGDLLDSTGVSGISQITEAVPSITFTKGNNESNSSLSIRGIGTNVFSPAVEPSVSVVFDGVVMARSGQSFQDFIDVERVEVLRGPQSTLFGKNASAGVVSVTTQDPTDYFSGKFDAMYAEGNEYQIRGTVSGPLSDTVGMRISAFHRSFDGLSTNLFDGSDVNGYEAWGLRGKLQFEPTPDLTVKLIGDYRDYEATPTFVLRDFDNPAARDLVAPLDPSISNMDVKVNLNPLSLSTQGGGQLNVEYVFANEMTLTSISAIRNWKFENELDVDGTPLSVGQPPVLPFAWDSNAGRTNLDQYSQEIRLASPDLGGFDFLVGAFAYKLKLDRYFQRRWVFSGPRPRSGTFNSTTDTTNLAAFVSGNAYFGDFNLFGGVRVIREELEWEVVRDPANVLVPGDEPLPGAAGRPADFTGSTSDTAVTGTIGLRYDFGPANAYVRYSRGYKGQGFNVAFASQEGSEPIDAESVDAFEAGLKLETYDGVFAVNAAAFYTKYDNYQAQAQRPNDITFELANAGAISTKGIELETSINPTELTSIRFGATLMDAKIDSFPGGPCYPGQTAAQGCVGGSQNLAGAPLPNAPDLRLTAFVRQYVPLGDSSPVDLYVQSNAVYQSEVQWSLNQDPRTLQDGYAVVNGAIGVEDRDGRYSLSVFVRNIFDQQQPASLSYSTTAGGRSLAQVWRNQERYFGVQGSFSF